jgi:hypothetical protein
MSGYAIKYGRENRFEHPGHPHKASCGVCGVETNLLICTDCQQVFGANLTTLKQEKKN